MSGPVYIPPSSPSDELLEGQSATSPTSLGRGTVDNFINTWDEGPTMALFNQKVMQDIDSGSFVPHEDIPADFKADFPNGTSRNVLNYEIAKRDHASILQDYISRMKPGVVSGTARFLSSAAAQGLDPVALSAGAVTDGIGDELIGLGAISGVPKMIRKFTKGSATGAALGATFGTSQYQFNKSLGQNVDPISILDTAGSWALLGGVLHTVFGRIKPVDTISETQSVKEGVRQNFGGKTQQVDPIYQNSVNAVSKELNDKLDKEKVEKVATFFQNKAADEMRNAKDNIPAERLNFDPALELAEELQRIQKPIDSRSDDEIQKSFSYQKFPYTKQLVDDFATNPLGRTPEQAKRVEEFSSDPINYEKENLERLAEKNSNDINEMKERIAAAKNSDPSLFNEKWARRSQDEDAAPLKSLFDYKKAIKERMQKIKTSDFHPSSRQLLEALDTQNVSDHHSALLQLMENSSPISMEKFENVVRTVNSPYSNYSSLDNANLDGVIKKGLGTNTLENFNEPLDFHSRQFEDYVSRGLIPESVKDEVENEIAQLQSQISDDKIKEAIDNTISCLRGE